MAGGGAISRGLSLHACPALLQAPLQDAVGDKAPEKMILWSKMLQNLFIHLSCRFLRQLSGWD